MTPEECATKAEEILERRPYSTDAAHQARAYVELGKLKLAIHRSRLEGYDRAYQSSIDRGAI